MIRRLFAWPRPKPAPVTPRDFTDEELAEALGLTRVTLVRPHVRAKPVNAKREARHALLAAERDAQRAGA